VHAALEARFPKAARSAARAQPLKDLFFTAVPGREWKARARAVLRPGYRVVCDLARSRRMHLVRIFIREQRVRGRDVQRRCLPCAMPALDYARRAGAWCRRTPCCPERRPAFMLRTHVR